MGLNSRYDYQMTAPFDKFDDPTEPRGKLSQIAVTIFVGIPSTIALVAGLAVYCTFRCATYAIFGSPRRISLNLEPPVDTATETFTASLANLADVHGPTVQVSANGKQAPVSVSKGLAPIDK